MYVSRSKRGQHEDACWTPGGDDAASCLQPVKPGHSNVHQDDVGAQLSRDGDGLVAVGRLAYHGQVELGTKDHRETGAEQALVVDEQDPDGHHLLG
jgi:hypothetical protein